MQLETVAEYVETGKTKTLLKRLGVTYAQGHAVGKPTDFDGVLRELAGHATASKA
jgi:EAL domain-containing protein (putative c-di-GMP-specific phosphodiesterase class I)